MGFNINWSWGSKTTDGFQYNKPNSVGGVSIKGKFRYSTPKEAKYITLYFMPKNSVEDIVYCDIRGTYEGAVKCVGPFQPNTVYFFEEENLWYNKYISSTAVYKAEIIYSDGTTETISGVDMTQESMGGCYVATAVYGSYDCPQVWTLRRYRDNTLASTWYGRVFIYSYYAISPTLVKWFGETEWFKKMCKPSLDKMVMTLNSKGVENTPYNDKQW